MQVLSVVMEKGGVGKTNLVCHAAWFFAERHRTLVIDLDQQANATSTLGRHLSRVESVKLFGKPTRVPSIGPLTVAKSTRELLGVEGADRACIEVFRASLASMADDYDVCVIDTPPSLATRAYASLLAADAVLAPIGIGDYSLAGVTELLRAVKGVSAHYKRAPPLFLGLLPSIFDRRSSDERRAFEELDAQVGKLLFPGIVAKRDAYRISATSREPVWAEKTPAARVAGIEIRGILETVEQKMGLNHG